MNNTNATKNNKENIKPVRTIELRDANDQPYELTFENEYQRKNFQNALLFLWASGYDVEKLSRNNWRKMHGMPMRRKATKR